MPRTGSGAEPVPFFNGPPRMVNRLESLSHTLLQRAVALRCFARIPRACAWGSDRRYTFAHGDLESSSAQEQKHMYLVDFLPFRHARPPAIPASPTVISRDPAPRATVRRSHHPQHRAPPPPSSLRETGLLRMNHDYVTTPPSIACVGLRRLRLHRPCGIKSAAGVSPAGC